jgi:Flp pilus assembly protein TadD
MKKQSYRGLAAIVVATAMLTGCKLIGDVEYKVQQDPVEMHGDSVRVNVTVKFPEKGLNKKASAEITPKLGGKAFKTITVQGEKATGNGQTIAYKPGATVSYSDVIPYSPDLENADLMITGKVSKGKKEEEFEPVKIADGTIITPLLVQNDDKALIGVDNFVRTTEETYNAQYNFAKGKYNITSKEAKDQDIKDLQEWLTAAQSNPKIAPKKMNLIAYASPEGETADNDQLARDRANSGQEAVMKIVNASGFEVSPGFYNMQPKGEDWAGFEKAVRASDMEDKNLIIRVLEMTQDKNKREQEIINMAKTYKDLEKEILPSLRRTQLNVVYDKIGWSDEELKNLSKTKADTLKIEELLFTGTLYEDLGEKMRIYKLAAANFPDDWRGHNNVGYVYYMQNDLANAEANFQKANDLNENPVTLNNLGIIARINGDRDKATELLNSAVGAGSEVKYNLGIIDIQNGDYAEAVGNFGGENTFNKALAQVLNGNAGSALSTLDASIDAESALGYYLKAIIGARQDNLDLVVNNLKSAISKDAGLKAKAATDREFIKFFENASFKNVVN